MKLIKSDKKSPLFFWPAIPAALMLLTIVQPMSWTNPGKPTLSLSSRHVSSPLLFSGFYYETTAGRTELPVQLKAKAGDATLEWLMKTKDNRSAAIAVIPEGEHFTVRFGAQPSAGIVKWGFFIDSSQDEYITGLMERVVDGPQQESWAPGRTEAMNLRGQKVEMLVKPTTSVYAPFYLSSRNYGLFVKTDWPGVYDFAATDPGKIAIEFEGPSLELKVYTAAQPAAIIQAHALDAGPPFLPPKWAFTPW